jgi:flagellar FliL protein
MRLLSLLLLTAILTLSGLAFAEEEAAAEGEQVKKEIAYVLLRPSLVANIKGRKAKFARCEIQFMTTHKERIKEIELHAPALRHELLLMLSEQSGDDLKDQEGKEKFRQAALFAAQRVIEAQVGENLIDDLFFTSFLVQ